MTIHSILLFAHLLALCRGACYFSAELQGEYTMQTVVGRDQVQYSNVHVTPDAIPVWGYCQQRQGDNVILNDSFNGTMCIRCVHLKLQSPNVLQVHTCPTCLQQCFLTEEAARNSCPKANQLASNKEITLFRTQEIAGGSIRKLFCPINGRYTLTYNLINETDNRADCNPGQSQLDSCAEHSGGPLLNVKLQSCTQIYKEMKFECLGDWAGPAGQRYMALLDTSAVDHQPQYRCALYKEDERTGNIVVAFSNDSTCTTDLYNVSYGHITWNLTSVASRNWPTTKTCSFPLWSQGKWEHVIVNNNTLKYNDHLSFNAYTMQCIHRTPQDSFIVYSTNDCGEDVYMCMRMRLRSSNVLEFQIKTTGVTDQNINSSLCIDSNFMGNVWVTQARLEGLQESPCPVTGEYSGYIPNNANLCARLASDQLHPETMYFTVSDCDQHEVYEEREYQCLGQWKEDGLTYTYTQRKDFGTYECFVGSIVSNNEIYIKEAGEHCGRGIDPVRLGMKLQSKAGISSNKLPEPTPSQTMTSWYVTTMSTKPWRPITAPPKQSGVSRSMVTTIVTPILLGLLHILYWPQTTL